MVMLCLQGKQASEKEAAAEKEGAEEAGQKRRGTEDAALRDVTQFLAQMQDTKVHMLHLFAGCLVHGGIRIQHLHDLCACMARRLCLTWSREKLAVFLACLALKL